MTPERGGVEIGALDEADLPGLVAIHNDVVATSTAIYSDQPTTLEERRAWAAGRAASGYPVLVARAAGRVDGGVLGYASFGDFRSWPGYRFTVEHSVHVRADRRSGGVGGALMRALLARARAAGKHAMVGGVDADNLGSIRFHERLGFMAAGRLPQVGYKFGRRLDLVFVVKLLDAGD